MTSLMGKIAQMLIMGFKGKEMSSMDFFPDAIMRQQLGGVILFDYDFLTKTYDQNIGNPEQLKSLTYRLQLSEGLPLWIGMDYEGGKVNRLKEEKGFPKTLSAAEIANMPEKYIRHYANQMARTLRDLGINLNFAPVVDLNLNPDNPIIAKYDRSFSNDPQKVIHCASLFANAFHENYIFYTYKHFPGHGSSTGDTHLGFVDVTDTWQPIEQQPYQSLLAKPHPTTMVMTSHVVNRQLDKEGYPASLSYAMTTGLLRKKLGFDGLIVTDDLQMKAISDQYALPDALTLAINAGADLLIFGNQLITPYHPFTLISMIYDAVKSGKITEERINESYKRIFKAKSIPLRYY